MALMCQASKRALLHVVERGETHTHTRPWHWLVDGTNSLCNSLYGVCPARAHKDSYVYMSFRTTYTRVRRATEHCRAHAFFTPTCDY